MSHPIRTLILSAVLTIPVALVSTASNAQGPLDGALDSVGSIGESTPSTSGQDPRREVDNDPNTSNFGNGGANGCPGGVCPTPGDQNANGVDDISEQQGDAGVTEEERDANRSDDPGLLGQGGVL